jgi:hypothetical protein
MVFKKFQMVAQIVGCVTIALLAIYGLLMVLSGDSPVWAAIDRAATLAGEEIPSTFNYQGFLRDPTGDLTTGSYTITARIYDLATGGTELYVTTVPNVTVRDGLFNIVLGDDPPMSAEAFSDVPRYIGISLNDDPELMPRQRLHAVPWALTAKTLVSNAVIDGLTSTDDITAANINIDSITPTDGDIITAHANLEVTGNITTLADLEVTGQSNLGPHFIAPVDVMSGTGGTTVPWAPFDASNYIPPNATAVILEAETAMGGPDTGDIFAHIRIRASGTSPDYLLLQGAAGADGDLVAWAAQGIYPVGSDRTFEYQVEPPGFDIGWQIRLIGYYR